MPFEFATAGRIIFGAGASASLGDLARGLGRRALLVTGRHPNRHGRLLMRLSGAGVGVTTFAVIGEPDVDVIEAGVGAAREAECDLVIGLGGGSALDSAKAIAALVPNHGSIFNYLETVGSARALAEPALACIAVPTTAGTGSEVTRNAVIAVREQQIKVSLRGASLLPRIALVDSELAAGLPPAVTASTGLDALTQLIEPYVSLRATPMTDAICVEGIRRAASALRPAFHDGANRDAREQMALASLWSGIALANAGLGAVHGLAGPIGGMFDAPHGAICAALLPHVMAANLHALRSREPESPVLRRFDEIGRLLTGRPGARAEDAVEWLLELGSELGIAPLGRMGVAAMAIDDIVQKAERASSMQANPIRLKPDELAAIVSDAM